MGLVHDAGHWPRPTTKVDANYDHSRSPHTKAEAMPATRAEANQYQYSTEILIYRDLKKHIPRYRGIWGIYNIIIWKSLGQFPRFRGKSGSLV